jgi:hypothetical protein
MQIKVLDSEVTGAISDDSPSRTTVCVRLMKRQRKLTLQVTPERVVEISLLVEAWLRKKKASLRSVINEGKFE